MGGAAIETCAGARVDAAVFAVYGTTRAQARLAAIEPVFRAVSGAIDVPCELAFVARRCAGFWLAAGRHVLKNMGGADDCSWASILSAAGYVPQLCDCGLGEVAAVRELYARHARALCATNE